MTAPRCIGAYQFTGRQPLDDELRVALQQSKRTMLARIGAGFLVASSVFWLAIPLDAWLLRPIGVTLPGWLVALWLGAMLVGMGYMSVCSARYGFASGNLKAGYLERFELAENIGEEVRAQRAIGALAREVIVAESLEILPRPPLIVRIDGHAVPPRRARVRKTLLNAAEPLDGCLMRRATPEPPR